VKCNVCKLENDDSAIICERCSFDFKRNKFAGNHKTTPKFQESEDLIVKWSPIIGIVVGIYISKVFLGGAISEAVGGGIGGAIAGGAVCGAIGGGFGALIGYFIVFITRKI
jgi:hypothetical protein